MIQDSQVESYIRSLVDIQNSEKAQNMSQSSFEKWYFSGMRGHRAETEASLKEMSLEGLADLILNCDIGPNQGDSENIQ